MSRLHFPRLTRLRIDRLLLLLGAAAVAITVVVALLSFGFRVVRSGSLPGMQVAGAEVGGLPEDDLRKTLTRLAGDRARERVRVARAAAGGKARSVVSSRRAEMGYLLDVEETAESVLARGRQANPYAALWDHVRATAWTITVAPEEVVEPDVLRKWATAAAENLSVRPQEGDLKIDGTTIEAVYPAPGAMVDPGRLARLVRDALLRGNTELDIEAEPVTPKTDEDDVDRIAEEAETAVSGPIVLARRGSEIEFTPEEIGSMLDVRVRDDDLELHVRPGRVRAALSDEELANIEKAPTDATFTLSGGSVNVVPSEPGFSFAPKKSARAILKAALRDDNRRGKLRGEVARADFSTKDAKALDISEQVSSFTTEHACCEPRVANIHRIADLVDGVVVEPGETFSLNGHVGPRTRDKGFVAAPSIREGEFVDEVGGGISQFATTMFNAIYFGGYDFLEYKAHSYYIDRYPMGREATISSPSPDLAFRNDSDAGIYIDTSYTDTSITVTFYGNTNVEVESETGNPHNRKDPPQECRVNKNLSKGESRLVSSGRGGFDVVVKRILVRDGDRNVEEFFTRYQPEPRIVERRRCRN